MQRTFAGPDPPVAAVETIRPNPRADSVSGAEAEDSEQRAVLEHDAPDTLLGVVAFGRVIDEDGQAIEGCRLVFEDAELVQHTAMSSAKGAWSLVRLEPGTFELAIDHPGFLPVRTEVAVPSASSWRHDLQLASTLVLPVRFEKPDETAWEMPRFSGESHARFLAVAATLEPTGDRIGGVRGRVAHRSEAGTFLTRAEGNAPNDLDARYQGQLSLTARPPLWANLVLRDTVLERRQILGHEEELVFVVDESALAAACGQVRVRLVDRESRAPIVTGVHLSHPSGGLHVEPRVDAGELIFEDVPPGTLDLELRSGTEYEWLEHSVDVRSGDLVDLGTIELGRRQPFRVTVVDAAGEPIEGGARLRATRPATVAGVHDLSLRMGLQVDAAGEAEVDFLAPGPTLLRAGGFDGHALVGQLVDTREETEVVFVVPAGVEVRFRREDGTDPGALFVLEDEAGVVLAGGNWLPPETCLQPGRYRVIHSVGGLEVGTEELLVESERLVVRYGGR